MNTIFVGPQPHGIHVVIKKCNNDCKWTDVKNMNITSEQNIKFMSYIKAQSKFALL